MNKFNYKYGWFPVSVTACRSTFTGETLQVEVLVLHPEDLAPTWLLTLVAVNQGLLCGGLVCVLSVSHYQRETKKERIKN